jgi:hypothetical protein
MLNDGLKAKAADERGHLLDGVESVEQSSA